MLVLIVLVVFVILLVLYLDVISNRSISNLVAELSKVHHESPQLILFKNGAAIYDASHQEINLDDLKAEL
jgi:bacillithiol system protein YtxJ